MEINVTDINDNSPEFLKQNYTFMIPENTTWDGELDISATDKDAGENGSLLYSLLDDYGMYSKTCLKQPLKKD